MVSGSGGRAELSDEALVESVLRELSEAADKWEALLGEVEIITYSVDLGGVRAVANSNGRLIDLTLNPAVIVDYTCSELVDRLNLAVTALREEVEADNEERSGDGILCHQAEGDLLPKGY